MCVFNQYLTPSSFSQGKPLMKTDQLFYRPAKSSIYNLQYALLSSIICQLSTL